MKATDKQYEKAVKLYEDGGASAVYEYAKEIGIDEWSTCEPCETDTPDCEDNICLVCGSVKEDYAHQRFINKSVDCYKCNALVDEREVMPNESKYGGDDNGGYLCKACVSFYP